MRVAGNAFCPCKSGLRYHECCQKKAIVKSNIYLWGIRIILGLGCIFVGVYVFQQLQDLITTGKLCAPIRNTNAVDCGVFAYFKLIAMTIFGIVLARFIFLISER